MEEEHRQAAAESEDKLLDLVPGQSSSLSIAGAAAFRDDCIPTLPELRVTCNSHFPSYAKQPPYVSLLLFSVVTETLAWLLGLSSPHTLHIGNPRHLASASSGPPLALIPFRILFLQ